MDFHFALPPDGAHRSGTPEKRPVTPAAWVQVKGHSGRRRRIAVKLDNRERMVKDSQPWLFVVVVLTKDGRTVEEIAVVPVDRVLIEKTLKRLRSLSKKDHSRLHQLRQDLTWTKSHVLKRRNGDALLAAVRRHIGADPAKYQQEKAAFVRTVGFDEKPIHGTFTIGKMATAKYMEMMADLAIGLRENVPIKGFRVQHVRFGIPELLKEERRLKDAVISIPDPPSIGKTNLTLTNLKTNESVTLECDTRFAHAVFPFLTAGYRKFRFVAPHFSMTLRDTAPDVKVSFEAPGRVAAPVGPLSKAGMATRLFASGLVDGLRLDLDFVFTGNRTSVSAKGGTAGISAEVLRLARALENAGFITRHFGLRDDAPIVPGAILPHADVLEIIAAVFSGTNPTGNFAVMGVDPRAKIHVGQRIAMIVCPGIHIGDDVVLITLALEGVAQWDTDENGLGRLSIATTNTRLMDKQVIKRRDISNGTVEIKLKAAADKLRADGVQLLIYDGPGSDYRERKPSTSPKRATRSPQRRARVRRSS